MDKDRIITVKKDGVDVEVYIGNPTLKEREAAESVRVRRWNQAIKDGAIFSEKLNTILKEQGIWSQEEQDKLRETQDELIATVRALKRGGIKKKDARDLAIKIRKLRVEINLLNAVRLRYVNETVEGQSQNAEFNYLVAVSAVYNNDRSNKYFKDYEEYLNRAEDSDALLIARKCSEVFYGVTDESVWPENEFLKKFKYVDDNLRLVNEDGHYIDTSGKLINEEGYYVKVVDGKDVLIDKDGNEIEELETKPYLEDDGTEIIDK